MISHKALYYNTNASLVLWYHGQSLVPDSSEQAIMMMLLESSQPEAMQFKTFFAVERS